MQAIGLLFITRKKTKNVLEIQTLHTFKTKKQLTAYYFKAKIKSTKLKMITKPKAQKHNL